MQDSYATQSGNIKGYHDSSNSYLDTRLAYTAILVQLKKIVDLIIIHVYNVIMTLL